MKEQFKAQIKQTKPVTVAYVTMRGAFNQMPQAFGKLYGWMGQKGYQPAGMPTAVYYDNPSCVPESECKWELCSEIAGNIPASGPDGQGLGVKKTSAMQVASTMHQGPYEACPATYSTLMGWIQQNGYQIAGPFEESYFNDPSQTPPEKLLTEIRIPVKK